MKKLIQYVGIAAISLASLLPLSCEPPKDKMQYLKNITKIQHSFVISCNDQQYSYNWDIKKGWETNDENITFFHVEKYYGDGLSVIKHRNNGCSLHFKTNKLETKIGNEFLYNDNSVTSFYNERMGERYGYYLD